MQGLLETIQKWHIHPAVDHFTVAILIVAVLADLFANIFSTRLWLRYAALALIIAGTAAAWGSKLTGGWEADRVWRGVQAVGGPAYAILQRHAELGDYLPWVFLVLAIWRIGVQVFSFMAVSRGLYLLFALLGAGVISYQGYLGGELVYSYGIGTALYNAESSTTPALQPEATGPATPIPTVYVPAAVVTPEPVTPTFTPSPSATASETPMPTATATDTVTPSPALGSPTATPSSISGALPTRAP